MNIKRLVIIVMFFCLLAIPAKAEIILDLFPKISTKHNEIKLNDICKIFATDDKEQSLLSGINICSVPDVGHTKHITKEFILRRLKQNRIEVSNIKFSGAEEVFLNKSHQIVSKNILTEELKDYLLEKAKELNELVLPMGDLKIIFSPPLDKLSPSMGLYINCLVDGKKEQTIWTNIKTLLEKRGIVARNRIKRHQIIKDEDLEMKKFKLTNSDYNSFYENKEQLLGKMSKVNIRKGFAIKSNQLEAIPVVKKGEKIYIVVENEKLRIVSIGETKEDGFLNEPIRVKNISSQKEVSGILKDKETVLIQY